MRQHMREILLDRKKKQRPRQGLWQALPDDFQVSRNHFERLRTAEQRLKG